jgi:hypothetical protein
MLVQPVCEVLDEPVEPDGAAGAVLEPDGAAGAVLVEPELEPVGATVTVAACEALPVDAVAAEMPRPRLSPAAVTATPASIQGCRIFIVLSSFLGSW